MQLTFLGQGYEPMSKLSVGNQLIKFFADTAFHSFTGISAFASPSGIEGLSKHISKAKEHLESITIIVGIDQGGTSKEALEVLLHLEVDSFIFYHISSSIFHPKIYLFEGKEKTELIIGSSNLTSNGLFANIEASILVSINNCQKEDFKIVEQLKEYLKEIFEKNDPNLQKLSEELIEYLVAEKIVPTEGDRIAAHDKSARPDRKEAGRLISEIFPKRLLASIPKEFRSNSRSKYKVGKRLTSSLSTINDNNLTLLWQSGPLTQRDLNIPKGSNTNPTGSMLFKKGKTADIDQRYYFRNSVFSSLEWEWDLNYGKSHFERAQANFKIIIGGIDYGDFELTISHNTKTDTRSFNQKNSMTSVSWGSATKIIARDELIGKNASLYSISNNDNMFIFIIE